MPRPPRAEDAQGVRVLPAYLLHGEDATQAREFVESLEASLTATEGGPPAVERYSPGDTPWRDILDVARMMPFAFAPWRILIVEAGKEEAAMSQTEADVFREYLADPTARTTLVVLFDGKVAKTTALRKAFEGAPSASAQIREFDLLKGDSLKIRVREMFNGRGCRVTGEAVDRLVELVDNDLGRLGFEVEKLATFAGGLKQVRLEDVEELVGGVKSALRWELQAALEDRNAEQALSVVHRIFTTTDRVRAPLFVLGNLSDFMRDLLLARSLAGKGEKSREQIYAELKPRYVKACRTFPMDKCRAYFALALRHDLRRFIEDLERIDILMKTTDSSSPALFEAFIWDFCRGGAAAVTSPRTR